MAILVKHSKVSTIPDDTDTSLVRPSDWNADHTLTGTIEIVNGGTGQTTASAAFDALAPSQSGNTGKYLTTNGTTTSWGTVTSGSGTVTSVAATAGTGISITGSPITTSGTLNITNTAPDQTVAIASGTGISATGTYPNFTVTNTAPDQVVALTGAGTTTISGTYPNFTITSADSKVGDVVGPASATDNAIARYDTTTGKLIQNSVVTVDDTGAVTGVTTLAASTSVTTPIVQATNSGGLALKNSAGTTQLSVGAGGGDNVSINVSTNINGANAQIDISPTGTGHVHIKPTGTGSLEIAPTNVGTINNMTIGATTARNASVVDLSVTGTLSFDAAQGTAGQVLTSAGTGNTPTWTTPTTGTVTSVTGTAPVVSSGGNTPAISMAQATTSVDGYLSSTDWTTFNNKGSGTVTSVAATVPSFLSVAGSPITTSGTLALTYSGTALPVANGGTGITSFGSGIATWLGTPSSANLASAVTDETGSGSLVFATSPTLVTPVLGTPSSGNLDSCTADGTNKVGYRNIPNSGAKTSSYTLVAGDVGKFIELGTGGSVVVPASVFAAGDAITIFNNTGASISCTCSAITDFYKGGTDTDISTFSVTTRGVATILFITTTRAVVTGNLA